MSATIGIDLGTSRCAVAVLDDRGPRVVPTPTGDLSEPSYIALTRSGPVCGEEARRLARHQPESTFFGALRLIGRKFQSAEVDWLRVGSPWALVAAPNGDVAIHAGGRDYTLAEIVSYLIEHLRRRAERVLGGEVHAAVIAVPASFDVLQRRGVVDAARLGGFAEVSLVNATTAALSTWSCAWPQAARVALVSLGGGSFEVTLADVEGGAVTVLAHAGDPMLGGDDLDRRIALHLIEQTGRSGLTSDPAALHALFELARNIRLELTERTRSSPIDLEMGGRRLTHAGLSRRQLVDLIAGELAGLKEPCRWAFEDAGLGTDDFDPVLALGEATHMPAVQTVIKYLFRRPPVSLSDEEVAVALGAARIAKARLEGRPHTRELSSQSVGIKVRGGRFLAVVPRNRPLPARVVRAFEAAGSRVSFELYQGENELAADNAYLGRLSLVDLGGGPFAVSFALDESGLVSIAQVDEHRGESRSAEIAHAGGLTPNDLARLSSQRAERSLPSSIPADTPPPRPSVPVVVGARRRRGTRRPSVPDGEIPPKRGPRAVDDTLTPPPNRETIDASAVALRVEADSLVGTELDGRYRIEEILGEGGMGRVYLAEHQLLEKRCAIKVLHPELAANRELAERFVREARAASSIDSDHVVAINDFGLLADGTGYFVMEYLDGATLEQVIDTEGPREAQFVVAIGRQIADALRGAHQRNIVHRDLKPSNIIIQRRDGRPFCKILDFGIAKSPTSDSSSSGTTLVTMAGVMMGTPHYMAPEQIDGEVDQRSDIYALGVVLFETLAGAPPFDAESVAELLGLQKWSAPPRVHDVQPAADCPPELEAVIRRCLEKDPASRFQSAREVAVALAALEI